MGESSTREPGPAIAQALSTLKGFANGARSIEICWQTRRVETQLLLAEELVSWGRLFQLLQQSKSFFASALGLLPAKRCQLQLFTLLANIALCQSDCCVQTRPLQDQGGCTPASQEPCSKAQRDGARRKSCVNYHQARKRSRVLPQPQPST